MGSNGFPGLKGLDEPVRTWEVRRVAIGTHEFTGRRILGSPERDIQSVFELKYGPLNRSCDSVEFRKHRPFVNTHHAKVAQNVLFVSRRHLHAEQKVRWKGSVPGCLGMKRETTALCDCTGEP